MSILNDQRAICSICSKATKSAGVCANCRNHLQKHLSEIPELQVEAGNHLQPGRSASGTASAERSIGLNVNALDYSMALELLAILHGWESMVREARGLTPPALLKKQPTTELEVKVACAFHLAHLDWIVDQDWVADFSIEVQELHAKGMAAAKRFKEQPRRIPCPTDDCKKFVVIDADDLLRDVTCYGCKQSWSVLRLVALAMSNPSRRFFLDVEAIALWLNISERNVYKIIKSQKIEGVGKLYDLAAIVRTRLI